MTVFLNFATASIEKIPKSSFYLMLLFLDIDIQISM